MLLSSHIINHRALQTNQTGFPNQSEHYRIDCKLHAILVASLLAAVIPMVDEMFAVFVVCVAMTMQCLYTGECMPDHFQLNLCFWFNWYICLCWCQFDHNWMVKCICSIVAHYFGLICIQGTTVGIFFFIYFWFWFPMQRTSSQRVPRVFLCTETTLSGVLFYIISHLIFHQQMHCMVLYRAAPRESIHTVKCYWIRLWVWGAIVMSCAMHCFCLYCCRVAYV